MFACLVACLVGLHAAPFTRDAYGVPHVQAESISQAYFWNGYATAQDRLWQMEKSRLLAEGRLASALGDQYLSSDKEVLRTAYTKAEVEAQIRSLDPEMHDAFEAYAKGVNAWMIEAEKRGELPPEYAQAKLKPSPWTPYDSGAIAIRLFQIFGRQGAGEVRDWVVLMYLQLKLKDPDKAMDVWDDILYQDVPTSPCTVKNADEGQVSRPAFPKLDREITRSHLALLPKFSVLDLLPGLSVAERRESTRVADRLAVPFRTGSYAIVVAPHRAKSGHPLLLSGPQMGHNTPSIVHEIWLRAPGLNVAGMDVPGVPGVIIGNGPQAAWAITTGVADTDDIIYAKRVGDNYLNGEESKPLQKVMFDLPNGQKFIQERTDDGPVLFEARGYLFVRRSSSRGRELHSMNAVDRLGHCRTVAEATGALGQVTMNMNLFFAEASGHIGYAYSGYVPVRAAGWDPRLPLPLEPKTAWGGYLTRKQMPHVVDPKSGLLVNWNNKPISWWPNLDTPVWGEIFHNAVLEEPLAIKKKIEAADLVADIHNAALTDPSFRSFREFIPSGADPALKSFDGRLLDGSQGALEYTTWIRELRKALFLPTTGDFMNTGGFEAAMSTSVMLRALRRQTHFDYLGSRTPKDVAEQAYDAAVASLTSQFGPDRKSWKYQAGSFETPAGRVMYDNRGTFIQVVDFGSRGFARTVLPPGESETGPHSADQVQLTRDWDFKSIRG